MLLKSFSYQLYAVLIERSFHATSHDVSLKHFSYLNFLVEGKRIRLEHMSKMYYSQMPIRPIEAFLLQFPNRRRKLVGYKTKKYCDLVFTITL